MITVPATFPGIYPWLGMMERKWANHLELYEQNSLEAKIKIYILQKNVIHINLQNMH